MDAIAEALAVVRSRKDLAGDIRGAVESLREVAQYRAEGDTVPLGDSLAGVVPANPGGAGALVDAVYETG